MCVQYLFHFNSIFKSFGEPFKTRFEDTGQNDQDITNQSPIQKFQIHFVELDFRYLFTEHILIEFCPSVQNQISKEKAKN